MQNYIPIKDILLGNISVQQIEEFEFIRNNPILSTLGAATLGGAIANDYHNHDYHSIGKYVGDKMDTVKNAIGSGLEKTRSTLHDATKPGLGMSQTIKTNPLAHPAAGTSTTPADHNPSFT